MWFGMISEILYSLGLNSTSINPKSNIPLVAYKATAVLHPGQMAVWFHYFPVSCRTGANTERVGCLARDWQGCVLYAGCQSSSRSSLQPHLLLIKQFQACSAIPGPTLFPLIINDICVPMAHGNESYVVIVWWGGSTLKGLCVSWGGAVGVIGGPQRWSGVV